ncbi:MAG: arginase family protein [Anaerolineales bacterium]|nr:arginase family protein [Anaerolineales bacterium]
MKPTMILTPYFIDQRSPGLDHLVAPDWIVNRPELLGDDPQARMAVLHGKLAESVETGIREDRLPVSIAGDCCAAIGVLGGLQRAGIYPHLIWFDAHGDFNTWETTPSGFLGGMPLAMLTGRGEQTLLEANQVHPLEDEKVILTDARDLDPGERETVEGSRICHLEDPRSFLERELPRGPLWVHFDTDVMDPEECPAMNFPAPGGPGADTLGEIFRFLRREGQIRALSLSSWAPELDPNGRSGKICLDLFSLLYN